jgi:hypothetical protein
LNQDFDSERCWAAISHLINDWWGGFEPENRIPEEEIAQAEERIGYRFPPELRNWYLLAGNLDKRKHCLVNYFLLPSEVEIEDEAIIFFRENADLSFTIGIKTSELESSPLRVCTTWPDEQPWPWGGGDEYFLELVFCFLLSSIGFKNRFNINVFGNGPKVSLEDNYEVLYSRENVGEIFIDNNTLIRCFGGLPFEVTAKDENSLKKVEEIIAFDKFEMVRFRDRKTGAFQVIHLQSKTR